MNLSRELLIKTADYILRLQLTISVIIDYSANSLVLKNC